MHDRDAGPGLVDSHVHLDRYDPRTRAAMLARAGAAGVARLLTVGVDIPSSRAALRLAGTGGWPASGGGWPLPDAGRPSPPAPLRGAHIGVHLARGPSASPDRRVADIISRARARGSPDVGTGRAGVSVSGGAGTRLNRGRPEILAAVGVHPLRLAEMGAQGAERALLTLLGGAAHGRRAGEADRATAPDGGAQGKPPHGGSRDTPAGDGPRTLPLAGAERPALPARPVAIGEIGLDAGAPDPTGQRRFLAACLALAADRDLPLVLHVVGGPDTHAEALAILAHGPPVRVVAHYFVGGPDLAQRYLEAGCWLAVGRPVTRLGEPVRAAVTAIPPERLLLETDTYPLPGRATEPADITGVCAAVAELTGRPRQAVAAESTAAFAAFIGPASGG